MKITYHKTGFKCKSLKIVDFEFFLRLQFLKRNIPHATNATIIYVSHATNAIIKNAISLKSQKRNHLTAHLKPLLWYIYRALRSALENKIEEKQDIHEHTGTPFFLYNSLQWLKIIYMYMFMYISLPIASMA